MKAKVFIGLLVLVALVLASFTACSTTPATTEPAATTTTEPSAVATSEPAATTTTEPSAAATSEPAATTETAAPSDETFEWRVALPSANLGVDSNNGVVGWACQEIERVSGGRLKVERVLSSTFGMSNTNSVQLLSGGIIESAAISQSSEAEIPILGLTAWPGLMPTYNRHLQIEVMNALVPYFESAFAEKGLVLIGTTLQPGRQIFMTSEMASLDDIKGAQIRVSSTSDALIVQALGATPVSIPFAETEMAIRQGVIDGLVTGVDALPMINITDAIKTVFLLESGGATNYWVVSEKYWNKLPADLQEIMRRVADEAFVGASWAVPVDQYRLLYQYQNENGWAVLDLTAEDQETIRQAGLDKISDLYDKIGAVGEEAVKAIEDVLAAQ